MRHTRTTSALRYFQLHCKKTPCNTLSVKNKNTEMLRLQSDIFITGVTILLSLTVFLNLVAEKMPSTSDAVPLIGRTYCFPAGRHLDTWRGRENIERLSGHRFSYKTQSRFSCQTIPRFTSKLNVWPLYHALLKLQLQDDALAIGGIVACLTLHASPQLCFT